MELSLEIWGKHEGQASCDRILYAPASPNLSYRHTRRYAIEFEGDREAAISFARQTLHDGIAQNWRQDGEDAFAGCPLLLEVGTKRGALDLEKEAILTYYRSLSQPGFSLTSLRIFHRYYIVGPAEELNPDRFIKDLVNPAIQNHRLLHGSCTV